MFYYNFYNYQHQGSMRNWPLFTFVKAALFLSNFSFPEKIQLLLYFDEIRTYKHFQISNLKLPK